MVRKHIINWLEGHHRKVNVYIYMIPECIHPFSVLIPYSTTSTDHNRGDLDSWSIHIHDSWSNIRLAPRKQLSSMNLLPLRHNSCLGPLYSIVRVVESLKASIKVILISLIPDKPATEDKQNISEKNYQLSWFIGVLMIVSSKQPSQLREKCTFHHIRDSKRPKAIHTAWALGRLHSRWLIDRGFLKAYWAISFVRCIYVSSFFLCSVSPQRKFRPIELVNAFANLARRDRSKTWIKVNIPATFKVLLFQLANLHWIFSTRTG